ncbi:MAG TPA: hypothetical protein VKM94_06055 [Blastocatellia bacterium]|nr:hypothetical protein [Blastocatellia bacterium]
MDSARDSVVHPSRRAGTRPAREAGHQERFEGGPRGAGGPADSIERGVCGCTRPLASWRCRLKPFDDASTGVRTGGLGRLLEAQPDGQAAAIVSAPRSVELFDVRFWTRE